MNIWFLLSYSANAKTVSVSSPDNKIQFSITDQDELPQYSVSYMGKPVINLSKLGFTFLDSQDLAEGLKISSEATQSIKQVWEQTWGESRLISDHHNELAVTITNLKNPQLFYKLRVRVFNDGLGFRYEVSIPKTRLKITVELTEFNLTNAESSTAWWIPAQGWNRYEFLYQSTPINAIDRVNTPFTIKTQNNVHLSIHEAALTDFASMTLDQRRPETFKAELVPWSDGIKVKTSGTFKSPWRTIQIADTATGLLNSHLILNLNEPNMLGDVSWVKPGK